MNNIEFLQQYATDIESRINEIKKDLTPLETGQMTISERKGGNGQSVDITQRMIDLHKRSLTTYERILAALNKRISGQAA